MPYFSKIWRQDAEVCSGSVVRCGLDNDWCHHLFNFDGHIVQCFDKRYSGECWCDRRNKGTKCNENFISCRLRLDVGDRILTTESIDNPPCFLGRCYKRQHRIAESGEPWCERKR